VPAGVDLPREKPRAIGTLWLPMTGQSIELYPCPTCKGPFVPTTPEQIKHCPRCGKDDIRGNRTIMYD
jgi:ribosomal protein L37AE/L43A